MPVISVFCDIYPPHLKNFGPWKYCQAISFTVLQKWGWGAADLIKGIMQICATLMEGKWNSCEIWEHACTSVSHRVSLHVSVRVLPVGLEGSEGGCRRGVGAVIGLWRGGRGGGGSDGRWGWVGLSCAQSDMPTASPVRACSLPPRLLRSSPSTVDLQRHTTGFALTFKWQSQPILHCRSFSHFVLNFSREVGLWFSCAGRCTTVVMTAAGAQSV